MKKTLLLGLLLSFLVSTGQISAQKGTSLPEVHLDFVKCMPEMTGGSKINIDNLKKHVDSVKKVFAKKYSKASILLMEAEIYFDVARRIADLTAEDYKVALAKRDAAIKRIINIQNEPVAVFLLMNGLKPFVSNSDTVGYIESCLQYRAVEEIEAKYSTDDLLANDALYEHAVLLTTLAKAQYNSGKKEAACKNVLMAVDFCNTAFFREEIQKTANIYCSESQIKDGI
ncbi:MAG: hypothetical protein LBQ31_05710 [Bacteroidales bacterium]|nr:hypothetical protein [Bacteroidales bacterium]